MTGDDWYIVWLLSVDCVLLFIVHNGIHWMTSTGCSHPYLAYRRHYNIEYCTPYHVHHVHYVMGGDFSHTGISVLRFLTCCTSFFILHNNIQSMLLIHMVNHTALHVEYMANGNNGSEVQAVRARWAPSPPWRDEITWLSVSGKNRNVSFVMAWVWVSPFTNSESPWLFMHYMASIKLEVGGKKKDPAFQCYRRTHPQLGVCFSTLLYADTDVVCCRQVSGWAKKDFLQKLLFTNVCVCICVFLQICQPVFLLCYWRTGQWAHHSGGHPPLCRASG